MRAKLPPSPPPLAPAALPSPGEAPAERGETIVVRGARVHNLRGLDCEIPLNSLTVVTGVSGSGKSSLAFDTIYAEGQRRYVESLSAYARQFLERMEKPAVDAMEGIPPAIAIRQRNSARTPRSTVATATEIYDYLRLLYARVGRAICPRCRFEVRRDTVDEVAAAVLARAADRRALVLFPVQVQPTAGPPVAAARPAGRAAARRGKKVVAAPPPVAIPRDRLLSLRQRGFVRLYQNGLTVEFSAPESLLDLDFAQPVFVIADRLRVEGSIRGRLVDAIETAYREAAEVLFEFPSETSEAGAAAGAERLRFSAGYECRGCGDRFPEPEPRLFSFNNPFGACPRCQGFGNTLDIDLNRVIPDFGRSLAHGAIEPWTRPRYREWMNELKRHAAALDLPLDLPWRDLSERQRRAVLEGEGEFAGVRGFFDYLERKKYKQHVRFFLSRYRGHALCPECRGARLRPEALRVFLTGAEPSGAAAAGGASAKTGEDGDGRRHPGGGSRANPDGESGGECRLNIAQLCALTTAEAARFLQGVRLTAAESVVASVLMVELRRRLDYLVKVGLDYLSLDRVASTLSGGEAQRIQLATCLGAKLVGSLYVLDEPSIGLHSRDTHRLIAILQELRDLGNTVLVVEHDPQIMRAADYLLDLGPGAGENGGGLIAAGSPARVAADPASLTGQFLAGARAIHPPARRLKPAARRLDIRDARARNLRHLDLSIPLGLIVAVTGVSGSGKSTLVHDVLYRGLAARLRDPRAELEGCSEIRGAESLREVVLVDQSPIGRTPRSNPATYIGAWDGIRQLLAATPEARRRGFRPGHFSFNVAGGRCDACEGQGVVTVEMQFLADVELVCEECNGSRFKPAVLEVPWRGKNVAEILTLTAADARRFFASAPKVARPLAQLEEVGLGYVRLGQSALTLSGGEAQRMKLAAHLAQPESARGTLFLLDEPTTGLHFSDIEVLLRALRRLIEAGGSVLVIEHNLDVIKSADWVLDLGPEGGAGGGQLLAAGPPEAIARCSASLTGRFLRPLLTAS